MKLFKIPIELLYFSSTSFSRSRPLLLGPRHFSKIQGFFGAHFFEIMVALSGIRITPDSFSLFSIDELFFCSLSNNISSRPLLKDLNKISRSLFNFLIKTSLFIRPFTFYKNLYQNQETLPLPLFYLIKGVEVGVVLYIF